MQLYENRIILFSHNLMMKIRTPLYILIAHINVHTKTDSGALLE